MSGHKAGWLINGYSILLFLHVSGAILIFTGIATLTFGWRPSAWPTTVEQVRAIAGPMVVGRKIGLEHISVVDVLTTTGVVLTAAIGLYMALDWGFGRGWIEVAIAPVSMLTRSTTRCICHSMLLMMRPPSSTPSLGSHDGTW